MKTTVFLVLAACAAAPHPVQQPVCPPTPTVTPVATTESTPDLDEATVKAQSHAFFDLFDRAGAEDLAGIMAPSFVWYEAQRFSDREGTLDKLEQRHDRNAPIHSRTWGDERVYVSGNSAVFVGEAKEHVPADGDRTSADEEGANTLVWVRTNTHWKVVLWQWDMAGIAAEQQRWNTWLTEGTGFNHKPNQTLVDAVKGRKPGTALDIATGQGRNAVFLATQGWKVTGVDIADQGLAMARAEAAKQKVKLETVQSEIEKYDLGKDRWDLVTMIYAGDDVKLLDRIKPAVKKGGLFVTEYFAADSTMAKGGAGGWNNKDLEAAFKDGWKILRDEHVEDNADWAGQRKTMLVRFVAQKL